MTKYDTMNGDKISSTDNEFGGPWTIEKLDMLERYLCAFTTALKNKPFTLIYIDAFAGTGELKIKDKGVTKYVEGSVERALKITDKQFDKLFFIEKNHDRYLKLEDKLHSCDRCKVEESDFNVFINTLEEDWDKTRGVLFLDPFGAAVDWSTIERIEKFKALDTWILYPTSTLHRLLPKNKLPDELCGWADKLDSIFGGHDWRSLYGQNPQQKLDGESDPLRKPAKAILDLYKKKLHKLFGTRFLDKTYPLKQNNKVLFEFMFCVGHPRGIKVAKKIAEYILTKPRG